MNGLALTSAAASSRVTTSFVTPGGRVRFVIDALDQMPEMTGLPSVVRGGDQLGLSAACNAEQASSALLIASARTIPLDNLAFMPIPRCRRRAQRRLALEVSTITARKPGPRCDNELQCSWRSARCEPTCA